MNVHNLLLHRYNEAPRYLAEAGVTNLSPALRTRPNIVQIVQYRRVYLQAHIGLSRSVGGVKNVVSLQAAVPLGVSGPRALEALAQ